MRRILAERLVIATGAIVVAMSVLFAVLRAMRDHHAGRCRFHRSGRPGIASTSLPAPTPTPAAITTVARHVTVAVRGPPRPSAIAIAVIGSR